MIKNAEKYIFSLLLFLLPSQLALHFWPSWAFVFGIRVDYLSPTIYLTDVLVFVLVVVWIINDHGWILSFLKMNRKWLIIIFGFAALNTIFSTSISISAIRWLKFTEFLLFALYVFRQNVLERKSLVMIIFSSAIFFSLIGVTQFLRGGTLGGAFYFLGERTFNSMSPGIALISIFGKREAKPDSRK